MFRRGHKASEGHWRHTATLIGGVTRCSPAIERWHRFGFSGVGGLVDYMHQLNASCEFVGVFECILRRPNPLDAVALV